MRKGSRLRRDYGFARRHRLHRAYALELGDTSVAEYVRGGVSFGQILVFDEAGEDDIFLYPFFFGQFDQVPALMPVADYHELCVNRSPYERQSAYEFVHALLGVEPAHVHVS